MLEDVLRVRVGQLRGVQVVEAHHAVADVKHSFAGGSDRNLKSNPAINDDDLLWNIVRRYFLDYILIG